MIAAERRRQITKEKWTAKHDAERHADGSLSEAAACYERCARFQHVCGRFPSEATEAFKLQPIGWPWEPKWFKLGGSAPRSYVKAGALFQAEIDRILKLFLKPGTSNSRDVRRLVNARSSLVRITDTLDRLLK